jgi:carboxypeptidase family protein/TonB-dependent receptor-like protein
MTLMKTLSAGVAAIALTTAFATVVSTPAMAQSTTSDIRGTVTTNDGSPAAGATITIVDTRTGASRSIVADGSGKFAARGLTVGGPYTVTTALGGYQTQRLEGVRASLGSSTNVNVSLAATATSSDEIVVVASRSNTAQLAIGPSSSFDLETIEALPSISRDIRDIIRLDPRLTVTGGDDNVSCLGGSSRATSFTIDGIATNDSFGLQSNGLPARSNFPIPFDSIRESAVEFAPYSVEYGNFTGCNVNIVTKSGTNEFHGAAFAVFNARSLTGSTADGFTVLGDDTFRDYNWGASIGGPVIKDKLFFYVAYEEIRDGGSVIGFGPEDGSFANPVANFTTAEANALSGIASSTYGFDAGGIAAVVPETSRRILTRWDYLITDDHRLEFTYSRERELEVEPDLFNVDFQFLNSFENSGSSNERYSIRLFSQWSDKLSTELRVSRFDGGDIQNPVGGGEAQDANPIPRLTVFGNASGQFGGGDDGVQVIGPGFFRSANALNTQVDQVKAKFDYVSGSHVFTGGYELNQLDVFNLFVPGSTGTFVFDNATDFANGTASTITAIGTASGDINDAAATFSRSIHSLYAQDEWSPTDALTLSLGLRYDFYTSSDMPTGSPIFEQRYGFTNSVGFDGFSVFLPRFGATYDAGSTLFGETTFRAGAGVFSGGDPSVFFSNAFTNNGFGTAFAGSFGGACVAADLQVIDGGGAFTGIPQCIRDQIQASASAGNGRVDAIQENLDIPSVVRGSFGLTHFTDFNGAAGGFFDDWTVNVDVIYSANRNTFDFVDLTLTPTGTILPDGRPQFNAVDPLLAGCDAAFLGPRLGFSGTDLTNGGPCDAGGDDQDILLTNAVGDNGRSISISAQFAKTFDYTLFDNPASWSLNLGYAYTDATVVVSNLSSTATSNFEETAVAIINNPVAAPSRFVNPHVVSLASTFKQEFVRDYPTAFSFFVQARQGVPFSYAYDNNTATTLFGDSDNEERNLFYVPTGPSDPLVQYAAGFDTAGFFTFLDESGLSEYAGQISPRGVFNDPWFVDVDFRFQQDLPDFLSGVRTLFFVDVENVLNLINNGSNVQRTFDRGDVGEAVPVLDASLSADGSQFVYSNFSTREISGTGGFDRNTGASLWSVQLGLRLEF